MKVVDPNITNNQKDRFLAVKFVVEMTAEDIDGLANSYEEIIDFIQSIDEHMADSVFTLMLKKMVSELE